MNNEIKEILQDLKNTGYEKLAKNIENIIDYITNLQKENEKLKSRIDKAIEYIETNEGYSQLSGIWEFYGEIDDLLNILRGDVKNG